MIKRKLKFILLFIVLTSFIHAQDQECLITKKKPKKASPSLVQCYRDNANTCCNSITDDYIKNQYGQIFSESCARNFPNLEIYFCFACSQFQPNFYSSSTSTIKLCKSFVEKIWGEGKSIDSSTDIFDDCGMNFNFVNKVGLTKQYMMPSEAYSSAQSFLNEFKPPFFSGATIEIVRDNKDCYNISFRQKVVLILGVFGFLVSELMI